MEKIALILASKEYQVGIPAVEWAPQPGAMLSFGQETPGADSISIEEFTLPVDTALCMSNLRAVANQARIRHSRGYMQVTAKRAAPMELCETLIYSLFAATLCAKGGSTCVSIDNLITNQHTHSLRFTAAFLTGHFDKVGIAADCFICIGFKHTKFPQKTMTKIHTTIEKIIALECAESPPQYYPFIDDLTVVDFARLK